jgi:hypothetical protein
MERWELGVVSSTVMAILCVCAGNVMAQQDANTNMASAEICDRSPLIVVGEVQAIFPFSTETKSSVCLSCSSLDLLFVRSSPLPNHKGACPQAP